MSSKVETSMPTEDRVNSIRHRLLSSFEKIENDARELVTNEFMFLSMMDALKECGDVEPTNHYYRWIIRISLRDLLVSIRRITDWDKETRSLINFLTDLKANANVISRDWFASQYKRLPADGYEVGLLDWQSLLPDNPSALPQLKIDSDIHRINEAVKQLRPITNTSITHAQKKHATTQFVPQTMHDAIHLIEKTILWYRYLLFQADNSSLLPCNIDELKDDILVIFNPMPQQ